eukprot:14154845-Heterocapsa_arctica.AAC.1
MSFFKSVSSLFISRSVVPTPESNPRNQPARLSEASDGLLKHPVDFGVPNAPVRRPKSDNGEVVPSKTSRFERKLGFDQESNAEIESPGFGSERPFVVGQRNGG